MRVLAIIAITCLLATAFATSEEEFYSKVAQMEKSNMGKTLLDTIYLQLQSEGPVEDLIRMLQQNEDKLQQQQGEDDDWIFSFQTHCDEELERLESEIEGHKRRIQELEDQLAIWIPERDQKIQERTEKVNRRALVQERVAQLQVEKDAKDAEWASEQASHDSAQYVIERAKQIIVEALRSKSFLQTNQQTVFAQVSTLFSKHAKQEFKRKSWNSIFNILAQITANAPVQSDTSLVDRVVALCDDLLDKIAQSREIERKDYQHFVDAYNAEKTRHETTIAELSAEISQLESEIDTLTKKINNARAEKADQEEARDRKQQLHDDLLNQCNQENVNYSERRQSRHDELEVVSDAIALLQSHLRLFRQYVSDRMGSVTKAK